MELQHYPSPIQSLRGRPHCALRRRWRARLRLLPRPTRLPHLLAQPRRRITAHLARRASRIPLPALRRKTRTESRVQKHARAQAWRTAAGPKDQGEEGREGRSAPARVGCGCGAGGAG